MAFKLRVRDRMRLRCNAVLIPLGLAVAGVGSCAESFRTPVTNTAVVSGFRGGKRARARRPGGLRSAVKLGVGILGIGSATVYLCSSLSSGMRKVKRLVGGVWGRETMYNSSSIWVLNFLELCLVSCCHADWIDKADYNTEQQSYCYYYQYNSCCVLIVSVAELWTEKSRDRSLRRHWGGGGALSCTV